MQASQERPPYVRFEVRATEDRNASEEAGHYVGKDTIFALITPQGSKDTVERVAKEWIEQNVIHARDGRLPQEWADAYKRGYENFKEGREIPPEGTPIMGWTGVGPAHQKAILDANVRTVEDLAIANEATLAAIGIGSRGLKDKAQAYLDTANNTGKIAEELTNLRRRVEDAESRATSAEARSAKLSKQLEKESA